MQIKKAMEKADETSALVESLYEAQQYVERRLQQIWLPKFTATAGFIARQRPSVNIGHVVDDVIATNRRRKVHPVQRVSMIARNPLSTCHHNQPQ